MHISRRMEVKGEYGRMMMIAPYSQTHKKEKKRVEVKLRRRGMVTTRE